jgi:galactokinase
MNLSKIAMAVRVKIFLECRMMYQVFAPGRVELLGNHTDYNAGVVMSAALDLGTTVTGERSAGSTIRLRSAGFPEVIVDALEPLHPSGSWSDYPVGVIAKFIEAGYEVGGFEAEFSTNLPVGAGLSSSASIEVATAVLLCRMFDLEISPMDLARLCKKAENEFAGVNCGILDQVSCIFGKRQHAIFLDCREESVQRVPFPEGVELLIVHSGVKHALTGGEYNERRDQCFEAARTLGVPALRDASTADLSRAGLSDVVRRRAAHITGENERVFAGLSALELGDLETFGRLLTASHMSSMENFENSTPELDSLVRIATSQPGVLGARLTGGGFGGAIIALVMAENIETAKVEILSKYLIEMEIDTDAYHCRMGDGAIPDA